jgi:transposase
MLLASSRGDEVPQIATNLGCGQQTVRDAIHDFNARGVDALVAKSSRPRRTRDAFDQRRAEALREMQYRSPREFGHQSSLWTLEIERRGGEDCGDPHEFAPRLSAFVSGA